MVKMIGVLDDRQKKMIKAFEDGIEQVKLGRIHTLAIISCMKNGPAYGMIGSDAASLYLALGLLQDEVKDKCRESADSELTQAAQRIIIPQRRQ